MIHIGIIHLPKPERRALLHTTVLSAIEMGALSVSVLRDNQAIGPTAMVQRALAAVAQGKADDELVCVMDDDLMLAPDALSKAWACMQAQPPRTALTLWTIEQNIPHSMREQRGWLDFPTHSQLWGGAVVMRASDVFDVRAAIGEAWASAPSLWRCPDTAIYSALRSCGIRVLHHVPSLADHMGTEASTLGNTHHNGETRGYLFDQWQSAS